MHVDDRYEEDLHINNHSSVWGSWWHEGQWGYACCHQTVKNSYCTGDKGKNLKSRAAEEHPAEANGSIDGQEEPTSSRGDPQANGHKDDVDRRESKLTGINPEEVGVDFLHTVS